MNNFKQNAALELTKKDDYDRQHVQGSKRGGSPLQEETELHTQQHKQHRVRIQRGGRKVVVVF